MEQQYFSHSEVYVVVRLKSLAAAAGETIAKYRALAKPFTDTSCVRLPGIKCWLNHSQTLPASVWDWIERVCVQCFKHCVLS